MVMFERYGYGKLRWTPCPCDDELFMELFRASAAASHVATSVMGLPASQSLPVPTLVT